MPTNADLSMGPTTSAMAETVFRTGVQRGFALMASMTSLFRGSPSSVADTAFMILLPTRSPKRRCTQFTLSAHSLSCFLTCNIINRMRLSNP